MLTTSAITSATSKLIIDGIVLLDLVLDRPLVAPVFNRKGGDRAMYIEIGTLLLIIILLIILF